METEIILLIVFIQKMLPFEKQTSHMTNVHVTSPALLFTLDIHKPTWKSTHLSKVVIFGRVWLLAGKCHSFILYFHDKYYVFERNILLSIIS